MNNPKIKIFNNYKLMSQNSAKEILKRIIKKPNISASFPTGSTPIETYKYLIKHSRKQKVSFSKVIFFELDEYLGLSKNNPMSYQYFLNYYLFKHLDFNKHNCHFFNGLTRNPEVECLFYEEELKKTKGLDLIILGIGNNGHIAFNEPGSCPNSKTRVIKLKESTIKANSRFFKNSNEVPRYALTMGLGDILNAKEIFLLANGKTKANAVLKAIKGPITNYMPASLLKKHPNVTYFLDKEAALLLKLKT